MTGKKGRDSWTKRKGQFESVERAEWRNEFHIVDSKIREEGRGKESCELLSSGGVFRTSLSRTDYSCLSGVCLCVNVQRCACAYQNKQSSWDLREMMSRHISGASPSSEGVCVQCVGVCMMCYSIISLGNLHPQCQGRVAICRNEKWINCVAGEKYRRAQQEITQIK